MVRWEHPAAKSRNQPPRTPRKYKECKNRRWTLINANNSYWRSSAFIGGFKFPVFLGALGVLGGSVFFVVSAVLLWFNLSP
jgi:hypothetical protein